MGTPTFHLFGVPSFMLFLLHFFSPLHIVLTATTMTVTVHNNFTDLSALLAFKAGVVDPTGTLNTNWSTNTSFCTWTGIYCTGQRVIALQLPGLSLQGTITPLLANLSFMDHLDLSNNSLSGSIPSGLGSLPLLSILNLDNNQISGAIPPSIFNLSSLFNLSLASNYLLGTLPANFTLPRLAYISLKNNNYLTGEILSSFARSQDLRFLLLSLNQFTGSIPTELTKLPELRELCLDNNNHTGIIPASIGNLTKLELLELSANSLGGEIPLGLGSLLNVNWMNLAANSFTGQIPIFLSNASMISFLGLSTNEISGHVPVELGNLRLLRILSLQSNHLTGSLDFITSLSNCRFLDKLQIGGNELDGVIPASVGNLSMNLWRLDGNRNYIKGELPAGLGNLSSLQFLNLNTNKLTGTIPHEITKLSRLQAFDLGFNNIHGNIPQELGKVTRLGLLSIGANALTGSIPDSIGNITSLQTLFLEGNRLSSHIPESMWSLKGIIRLTLSHNYLQGSLSPNVGNLKAMVYLDLSVNLLEGSIPDAFGELQMLDCLDVSYNSLQGLIPQSFGGLISMTTLNLSYNALSGAIPNSLASLRYLAQVNFSFNRLAGQVPTTGVFSNLTIQSLMGNTALCGGAPQLDLPPCSNKTSTSRSLRKRLRSLLFILLFVALAPVLVLSCLFIFRIQWKRTGQKTCVSTPHMNDYRLITFQELLRATDNFSNSYLLGRGFFGSVFKGHLDDGLVVAIKVMNPETEGALQSFEAEIHALGAVRHRNLIKIISICFRLDCKALILQYMSNGSLDSWLYSQNDYLTLLQRINIMLDVAMALEYLHHHHPQVVIHCDLKPSNVLLDEDMTGHVSDFGIAKLLRGDSNSIASSRAPGTIGYMAPEYGMAGKISRRGDIYSYGVLLLETLTGKKPTDAMFQGELSLRQWVFEAHSNSKLDILDDNILRDDCREENIEKGPDATHQCLLSMIEIGLLCSKDSPKERIPMIEVVPMLEKIKEDYLSLGMFSNSKLLKKLQI